MLEIMLNTFRQSTILQEQFIIIIIVTTSNSTEAWSHETVLASNYYLNAEYFMVKIFVEIPSTVLKTKVLEAICV